MADISSKVIAKRSDEKLSHLLESEAEPEVFDRKFAEMFSGFFVRLKRAKGPEVSHGVRADNT